jgi:uncharacterized protein
LTIIRHNMNFVNLLSIEIRAVRKDRELNMKGGIVLDGFPSIGLVNAIASECLIRTAGTELLAVIESPEFPPLSVISNSLPKFPARLHINEALKVAFFISEFNIDPSMQNTLGKIILNWAIQNECKMIVSGAGILSHEQDPRNAKDTSVIPNEHRVYAATSTHSAAKIAKENDFVPLKSGWIGETLRLC